jgi:hypothetical protein
MEIKSYIMEHHQFLSCHIGLEQLEDIIFHSILLHLPMPYYYLNLEILVGLQC